MAEIDKLEAEILLDGVELEIHNTVLNHISIFKSFLSNVDVVGLDAAFEAYMMLCLKLKRRETTTDSQRVKDFIGKIWPEIERWAGRLSMLNKAYASGHILVERALHASQLIGHVSL